MKAEHRPLYAQVRERLTARIADGEWQAGSALPSEFALAGEMGVSQGTVRKALDAMAAENQLERRQGKGTYVPLHTPERALFHFFRITDEAGAQLRPETIHQAITRRAPLPALALTLASTFPGHGPELWHIWRCRALRGKAAIVEDIWLDPRQIADPGPEESLPNALYSHYQALAGLSIARAVDLLSVEEADARTAQALGLAPGAPLLRADRVAENLRGAAIELRITRIHTAEARYRIALM